MALNSSSVTAANKAFWAKHPERKGKIVDPSDPAFKQLAREWNNLYRQAESTSGAEPTSSTGSEETEAGSPVQSCPYATKSNKKPPAKPPQKEQPCYFQRFKLTCSHRAPIEYRPDAAGEIESSVSEKAKEILTDRVVEVVAKPEPDPDDDVQLEFMGNPTGQADKVTLEVLGGAGCAKLKHRRIRVYDEHKGKWIVDKPSASSASFEAKGLWIPFPVFAMSGPAFPFLQAAWHLFLTNQRMRRYFIQAEACPYSPDGNYKDKLGSLALTVVAYPSDEYTLAIKLKPKYKRKTKKQSLTDKEKGTKTTSSTTTVDKGYQKNYAESTEKSEKTTYYPSGKYKVVEKTDSKTTEFGGKETKTSTTAVNQQTGQSYQPPPVTEEDPEASPDGVLKFMERTFELKRNEQKLYRPKSEGGLIEKIRDWIVNIQRFVEIVQQFGSAAPKIGWWVDFEFEVLSGSINAEWKFKESKSDHYVYRYWKVGVELVLLGGKLEVHYGAKIDMQLTKKKGWGETETEEGAVEASIYLTISGTLSAKGSAQRDEPSQQPQKYMKIGEVEGKLEIELGAEAVLGSGDVVTANANVKTCGTATGEVSVGSPHLVKISAAVRRGETVVTVTASLFWGKLKGKRKITLAKEGEPIALGEWPAEAPVPAESQSSGAGGGGW